MKLRPSVWWLILIWPLLFALLLFAFAQVGGWVSADYFSPGERVFRGTLLVVGLVALGFVSWVGVRDRDWSQLAVLLAGSVGLWVVWNMASPKRIEMQQRQEVHQQQQRIDAAQIARNATSPLMDAEIERLLNSAVAGDVDAYDASWARLQQLKRERPPSLRDSGELNNAEVAVFRAQSSTRFRGQGADPDGHWARWAKHTDALMAVLKIDPSHAKARLALAKNLSQAATIIEHGLWQSPPPIDSQWPMRPEELNKASEEQVRLALHDNIDGYEFWRFWRSIAVRANPEQVLGISVVSEDIRLGHLAGVRPQWDYLEAITAALSQSDMDEAQRVSKEIHNPLEVSWVYGITQWQPPVSDKQLSQARQIARRMHDKRQSQAAELGDNTAPPETP